MRIKVVHQTRYRYAQPARGAIQILHLTPRDHDGQHVLSTRIEVEPNARLRESEDCFGNVTHIFNADGPLDALSINMEGEIEASDTAGVIRGAPEPFPPILFLRETPLTAASDALRAFARDEAHKAGDSRLDLLHRLMIGLNTAMRFETGGTDAATTASDAFSLGRGVCQDFAHMFICAARICRIPSRYVSGYLARGDAATTQEAGHAWAEAYVEELGWVGFDAANGVSPTGFYVRAAVGLDYLGAAPILGARQGGGGERLEVRVDIGVAPPQLQNQ